MLLKLDLEKAYDMVDWNFLRETLQFFGFPKSWVNLIMEVVGCVRPQILWNRDPTEPIVPTRGLRQGDPLSPYLFVLCMERLSYLIEHAVENGKWASVLANRGAPTFSHMLFADDIVLLAKATPANAACIHEILRNFFTASSLRISNIKSKVWFLPCTDITNKANITNILGIGETDLIGKYLGIKY